MAKKQSKANSLRSQLKATPIKVLEKRVNRDDEIIGANNQFDYLNLEDGKLTKIRIFPAHPGESDFYVPKKSYWLTVLGNDGNTRRTTVLDSKIHGGTKYDIVEEYVKWAKKKHTTNAEILEALTGTGMNSNSLNPTYSWVCYADVVQGDNQLNPKLWEFKKMVRDGLNKLAFSEDEDEAIEVDPFTDPDEGLPVNVKFLRSPNKKKGEQFYEVSFPIKPSARPLTDEEIEKFMNLTPLKEMHTRYGIKDFERALEGLQYFDEEHEVGLFEDEDWLERLDEIRDQYDEEEEEEEKPKKKATRKVVKKVDEVEEDDDELDESEEEEDDELDDEEEDEEEDEEDDEEDDDELDDLDRKGLKKHIKDNKLGIRVKKSMTEDDIREEIRSVQAEEAEDEIDDEAEEAEEDAPKAKVSLSDIRKKLAGKK